jgi:thiol-disulfide isomerase/thioredoxin
MAIEIGSEAPVLDGATQPGPHALLFYKVTCPTCQMAAAPMDRFEQAYPGRIAGVGQDPEDALETFSGTYGLSFPSRVDPPPYEASHAYGIEHVPTLVVVDDGGIVAEVVESWDREGLNRASARLAELLGAQPATISDPADGLPAFRPG